MKIHERFFTNFLSSVHITDDDLNSYGKSNISLMSASNPSHIYDAVILATKTKQQAFEASIVSKTATVGSRMGATFTLDQLEAQYVALVERAEGTVKGTYPKKSAVYLEFFIKPLTYYTRATRDKVGENIIHFVTLLTDHPELDATVLADFQTLQTNFAAARGTQMTDKSNVKSAIQATSAVRIALENQLMTNVLTIALNNIGHPEVVNTYFDPSLLYPKGHTVVTPGVVHIIKIKPLVMRNSRLIGLQGMSITVNVTHGKVQLWASSNIKKPKPAANAVTQSDADGKKTYDMTKLGDKATDKYLIVYNLNPTQSEIEIELTGGVKYV